MKQNENKFVDFLRRNAVYLVLSLCIIAIGVSVTLVLVSRQNDFNASVNDNNQTIQTPNDTPTGGNDQTPSDPVEKPDQTPTEPVDVPITFSMPIENPVSVGEYSETMVWNGTLGRFSSHMAIDFYADEGTAVVCAYDGIVKSVETTLLKGTTIVVDHGDGLTTVYNSLLDGEKVFVGQTVKKGQTIGEVSLSNRQEASDGAHLHFEVLENGENVDPAKYIVFSEK